MTAHSLGRPLLAPVLKKTSISRHPVPTASLVISRLPFKRVPFSVPFSASLVGPRIFKQAIRSEALIMRNSHRKSRPEVGAFYLQRCIPYWRNHHDCSYTLSLQHMLVHVPSFRHNFPLKLSRLTSDEKMPVEFLLVLHAVESPRLFQVTLLSFPFPLFVVYSPASSKSLTKSDHSLAFGLTTELIRTWM